MRRALVSVALSGIALASCFVRGDGRGDGAPGLQADDLFRVEGLGAVSFSPDGAWLAYEVHRPAGVDAVQRLAFNYPQVHGDIWLVPLKDPRPENVTQGAAKGTGFWNPIWSPDGSRLALLGVQEGRVRLYLYELGPRTLRQLSEVAVKQDVQEERPYVAWISPEKLVVNAWLEGEEEGVIGADLRPGDRAARQWERSRDGRTVTSTVLDSGLTMTTDAYPVHRGRLVVIDARTATVEQLASGELRRLSLSPDRRRLAFFKRAGEIPAGPREAPLTNRSFGELLVRGSRLEWVDLESVPPALHPTPIEEPADFSSDSLAGGDRSPSWSPDGEQLIIRSRGASSGRPSEGDADDFQRLDVASGRVAAVRREGLEVLDCSWANGHELLVYARSRKPADAGPARADWWLANQDREWVNVTSRLPMVPREWLIREEQAVVGVAAGALLRLEPNSGDFEDLSRRLELCVSSDGCRAQGPGRSAWVVAADDGLEDFALLSLATPGGALRRSRLPKPSPRARLRAIDPRGTAGVFEIDDDDGTSLSLGFSREARRDPSEFKLFAGNQWRAGVKRGELRPIVYPAGDFREQKGWVLLPPDARPGVRLPLVVWVYGGASYGGRPPPQALLGSGNPYNLQILAAHGYAVLFPSMPVTDEPCRDLVRQVLPAVDHVVSLGWADPDRVAVMGLSYGAYSTLCLVGQSDRFRAAVALATPSSTLSATYGSAAPASRYGDFGHPQLSMWALFWQFESGQMKMGTAPFRDPEKYRRNSPMTYVDRVKTPVLLLHGDGDPWSPQASEEFYAGLLRQGKRARLVRYAGEGHAIEGRANLDDAWRQIFQWLDELVLPVSSEKK